MIDVLRSPLLGLGLGFAVFLGAMGGAVGPASGEDEAPAADGVEAVASNAHPVVPGFERFHEGPGSDAVAGGLILLGELNCTSCHEAGGAIEGQVLRKRAPILDSVGSRVRPEYLRAFLDDPHAVKPGTTMPDLLGALPAGEKAETVEALVHFLASTGRIAEIAVDARAIANGKKLYHEIGCVACHGRRSPDAPSLASSMPLGDLASKYTVSSLTAFLRDPLKVRPSGRMPALNLVKKEPHELACYLLEGLKGRTRPVLTYEYYEGKWDALPDFDALTPKAAGETDGFDVSVARRRSNMALRFEGYFHNKAAGEYTFHLTSDDGSKLFIDGALVVDNDGLHPPATETGKIELIKGAHTIVVVVFNASNDCELEVEYEGRGLERQSALAAISLDRDEVAAGDDRGSKAEGARFRVDRDLAEKGRGISPGSAARRATSSASGTQRSPRP